MRHVNLLIKPASGLCNLKCRYCFYRDLMDKRETASYGIMTEETLENVVKKGIAFAEHECTIAFQGGEPTLAGLDFFKRVVELQKKHNPRGIPIHNALQTNGVGLDGAWADFLRENRFLVGLSLDGVKDTHDLYRMDGAGDGTFARVMDTVRLFERRGVEYNILTVVNRQTAKRAEKIYNFYKKNKLQYLQFIPCLDPIEEEMGQAGFSLTPREYGAFLCTLFDLWCRDVERGEAPSVRQFENYIEMLLGGPPEACGMNGVCGMQHVVEADGSVYPCDFYVLDRYRLGNLNEVDLEEINRRRAELRFIEESTVVDEKCKTCRFFALCRGGCRRNRPVSADGALGRNFLCEGFEMFFTHAMPRLQGLARVVAANMK